MRSAPSCCGLKLQQSAKLSLGMSDLRVLVVGISGAGKTTFARRLAAAAGVDFLDLDVVNWRPGWVDRSTTETSAFIADIEAAAQRPHWAISGSYHSKVGERLWRRATHAVWLDLPRLSVMAQVVPRSLQRAWGGKDVFPGCRETWPRLITKEHPIRWAWDNHARRRATLEAVSADPAFAHVHVLRCRSRREADAAMAALIAQARGLNMR